MSNQLLDPKLKREQLIGISNFVRKGSLATIGSQGGRVLSTAQEIRDSNRAIVVLPHLSGVKKISDYTTQIKNTGTIIAGTNKLHEVAVDLQEYITDPFLDRPRDREQTTTQSLLGKYMDGWVVSTIAARDKNYLASIYKQIVVGVDGAKGAIVESGPLGETPTTLNAQETNSKLRAAIREIVNIKDRHGRGVRRANLVIFASPTLLQHMKQEQMGLFNPLMNKEAFTDSLVHEGMFDGVRVYETNELDTPLASGKHGVHAVIMMQGAAISPFVFRDTVNYDKEQGINVYKASLEFNAATLVALPNYITVFADLTASGLTANTRVNVDTVDLSAIEASDASVNRGASDTTDPANGFDASKSNDGKGKA